MIRARFSDGRLVETVPQLCAALGITYRQFDHWCRRGFVRPDEATPGSGYHRGFAPDELRVLVRMARLVNKGMAPGAAAVAAREPSEQEIADQRVRHAERAASLAVAWMAERGECA